MSGAAHRNDDTRYCGAKTIVTGQSHVFVNGKLWAVEDDECDHGEGALVSNYGAGNVRINGKKVIVVGDLNAKPDLMMHPLPPTDPESGSDSVFAYAG